MPCVGVKIFFMYYSKAKMLCRKNLYFHKLILLMILIGETALSYAAVNGTVNVVRYLLDHGANPDKSGPGNRTPLHMAVAKGLYLFSISVGTIYNCFLFCFR